MRRTDLVSRLREMWRDGVIDVMDVLRFVGHTICHRFCKFSPDENGIYGEKFTFAAATKDGRPDNSRTMATPRRETTRSQVE